MAKTELILAERVALLEQELAEIKALLKEQVAKSQPAPAIAMAAAAAASVATSPVKAAGAISAKQVEPATEEGVSPEIMVVISAAVTHFLGLRARIRHAHMVRPTGVNPWAQQGRVFVQASHNLMHR